MRRKWFVYGFIFLLGFALLLVKRYRQTGGSGSASDHTQDNKINRNRGFDRRISYLEYTRHARCRMDCRHITQAEVQNIMKEGTINYRKSDLNAKPCPEYALEGSTDDGQRVRIIFA